MNKEYFSKDILDFLYLLSKYRIKYLIVGGEAVIYYGYARLTGDIDILYERSSDNTSKLFNMLNEFWENDIPGIKIQEELMQEGTVFQFGVPPNRIDLLNQIEGIIFEDAWEKKKEDRLVVSETGITIYYIGLEDLIVNKKAVSRHKDKDDLRFLMSIKKSDRENN